MLYRTRSRICCVADGRLCRETDTDAHHLVFPAGAEVLVDEATAARLAAYEESLTDPAPAEIRQAADPEAATVTFGTAVPAPNRPTRTRAKKD